MVDAVFSKRQEAKTAVCLQAISEDVGEYIRSTGTKYNESMTKEMKVRDVFRIALAWECVPEVRPLSGSSYQTIYSNYTRLISFETQSKSGMGILV